MKKLFASLVVCLMCLSATAATNKFFDSSVTYAMTGTVLDVAFGPYSYTMPSLQSVLLTMPASVSNRVSIQFVRGSAVFYLWDSLPFVGFGVSYYFDNELKLVPLDTVRVTKTAPGTATVIFNWK